MTDSLNVTQPGTKNIVIFSDGTGQRGGLLFDERRSNIYKLFRATRCGPDSPINPAEQLTSTNEFATAISVGDAGLSANVANLLFDGPLTA